MTDTDQTPEGPPADAAEHAPADGSPPPPAVPDAPEDPDGLREVDTADEPAAEDADAPAGESGRGAGDDSGQDPVPDWEARAAEDPRSRAELLADLRAAEEARDEYLDALQRTRAEFDNYRKRMMREGGRQREAGKAEVAEALLEVLDDFDRTLEAAAGGSPEAARGGAGTPGSARGGVDDARGGVDDDATGAGEGDGLARGVELVYGNLVDALKSVGLSRIDETGVPFDPNRHEAVQRRDADEDDDGEPVVVEVFRPGYAMSGRVVRAAMVVVEQ